MRIALDHERATIIIGDSAKLAALLPPNSIDAIVTDPPSGIAFMGKAWDRDRGGRDGWVAWLAETLAPAFAALKPGGHALVWALPRTSHWTALALELCGFEIRDRVSHLFGSGFPKSMNVSKAIDAYLGHERPVTGAIASPNCNNGSPEAAAWEGWGTALKPACEDWWLVRKPLGDTVAGCVLEHGTGALNIDASRVGSEAMVTTISDGTVKSANTSMAAPDTGRIVTCEKVGRWPANLMLSHDDRCVCVGQEQDEHVVRVGDKIGEDSRELAYRMGRQVTTTTTTIVDVYACVPGCPVRVLDEQSGPGTGSNGRKGGKARKLGLKADADGVTTDVAPSKGGASRFFYVAKPSKSETDLGLDHLPKRSGGEATDREDGSAGLNNPRGAGRGGGSRNCHPTKKSVALMRYLITLITPPGGIVLDPFAGSGTTGVAALGAGFRFVGVEQGGDAGEYVPIILGRIAHALGIAPPTE